MRFLRILLFTPAALFIAARSRRKRRLLDVQYSAAGELIDEPETEVSVTRTADETLLLRWTPQAEVVTIYAGPAPDAINREQPQARVAAEQQVALPDPHPGRPSCFELSFSGGPADGLRLFASERFHPLQGVFNLRDIGGYRTTDGRRVRWGRVFRSGVLSHPTPPDTHWLAHLAPCDVYDLRSTGEAARDPDQLPDGLRYHSLPFYARSRVVRGPLDILRNLHRLDALFTESYIHDLVESGAPALGVLLRRLAQPEQAALLVHCTAGKDRTGFAAAVLLLLLGVPQGQVLADYSLSNHSYDRLRAYMLGRRPRFSRLLISIDELVPMLVADPAALQAALDYITAHYGSLEAYLARRAGVDAEAIARLRENLLE